MIRATLAGAALLVLCAAGAAAVELQGHRGARGLAPENTLPAFAKALSLGVDVLELDTAVTADDQVIVSHDPALNPNITRAPDGAFLEATGPVIAATPLAELLRYDVGRLKPGTRYAQTYPDQVAADGTRLPRLAEVFALVAKAGNAKVRFNIEIKTDPRRPELTRTPDAFADRLVAEIRASGMTARVTIQSFDWRSLKRVQASAADIAVVHLTAQQSWLDNVERGKPGASPWLGGPDADDQASTPRLVAAVGGKIWSPFFGDLTPELVKEAQSLGLKVVAWTPNTEADMARLINWGVDGLITDRPDRARAVMAAKGLPLPAASPVAH